MLQHSCLLQCQQREPPFVLLYQLSTISSPPTLSTLSVMLILAPEHSSLPRQRQHRSQLNNANATRQGPAKVTLSSAAWLLRSEKIIGRHSFPWNLLLFAVYAQ